MNTDLTAGANPHGSLPPSPTSDSVSAPTLVASGVGKHFGKVEVLRGVDLTIQPGEFVTLLGPSGCGKSTLLRIIAGIELPNAGTVTLSGAVVNDQARGVLVPPERRNLGMVFQSYAVWPHMTVAANVGFPLRYRKVPRSERAALVTDALAAVQLETLSERYPHQLSGGQQQRVALARAIVARPPLLLLDEPLSNLDARLREDMRLRLKRLHVELGLTMLYVTHDQSEALAMSDRILVMDAGTVLQEGSPETVYGSPASLKVARFLGLKNILELHYGGPEHVVLGGRAVPARHVEPATVGDVVSVAIRPDGFRSDDGPDAIRGQVELVEFLGSSYEHEVVVDGIKLLVQTPTCLGRRGDTIGLSVVPGAAISYGVQSPGEQD